MKKFLILSVLLIAFTDVRATHIIGGDFTVQHVSDNTFEVTLNIFRDCSGGGAELDGSIQVSVYEEGTNNPRPELDFNMVLDEAVVTPLGDDCFTPDICLQIGTYITAITLPNFETGYYFTWERCCRNVGITNLALPGDDGIVFLVTVPDPAIQNSTPVFQPYPTDAYLCINGTNSIDFGATDVDGDSLVYRLETPLQGELSGNGGAGNPPPAPNLGGPKPHLECPWLAPYDLTNICDGMPPMSIDSETGVLTASPDVLGLFALAIAVDEYRNGTLISTIRREIQLQSTLCILPVPPQFVDFEPIDTIQVYPISENTVNITIEVSNGEISTSTVGGIFSEDFEPQATVDISGSGSNINTVQLSWDSIPCDYIDNFFLVQLIAESDNNCLDSVLSNSIDLYLQVVDPDNLCITDGIEEIDGFEVTIFPNPFQEVIKINSPRHIPFIQILTTRGIAIKEKRFAFNEENIQIDLKNLPSGIYFIKCFDKNEFNSIRKVIKN